MEAPMESLYEVKARLIAVLANPRRLAVIDLLSERERTVSELSTSLGLAQAATSQHLSVMRRAGVVKARKQGNHVYYCLADPRIASACGVMSKAVVAMLVSQQEVLKPLLAPDRRGSRAAGGPG